jgi:hypothetical protein
LDSYQIAAETNSVREKRTKMGVSSRRTCEVWNDAEPESTYPKETGKWNKKVIKAHWKQVNCAKRFEVKRLAAGGH